MLVERRSERRMGMRRVPILVICVGLLLVSALTASAQDIRAGVEQLASQVAKAGPEGKQLRVAVTDFPNLQGVTCDLGRYFSERLTTRLAQNPRFLVVERRRLAQVLGELRFSMSDLVDPAKAKQLGRMAGVEAIVVGSVSDLGNQVDLDARMIEIETNRMLLGATTTISKDQVVQQLLERGCVEAVAVGPPQPPPGPPGQPAVAEPLGKRVIVSAGNWRIEVERGEVVGDELTLHVKVDNLADVPRDFGVCQATYLVAEGITYQLRKDLHHRDARPQIFRRGKFALAVPPNFLKLEACRVGSQELLG